MRHFLMSVLAFALGSSLAQVCGGAENHATAESVGSEAGLRALIAEAIAAGKHVVQIPPGRYRIGPELSRKAHLLLQGVHDLRINAAGVELLATDGLNTPVVALYDSSNVTIEGLTVDCDPVVFLQGKVASIEPQRRWYDIQVDPGYDLDPTAIRQAMRPLSILDKSRPELPWKHGVPDLYHSKVEWVSGKPRLLRVYTMAHCRGRYPVEMGDPAVLPAFGACGFTCCGSRDITFRNCTIYQAGSMAFHEHGGGGNTHLEGCKVMRRPGSGRLLSTNADGFHCKNMRKGPTIEDCLFEGMHDDGVNIHGMFGRVAAACNECNVLRIVPFFEEPGKPGDTIEFFSGKTGQSLGQRTLRLVHCVGNADPGRAATYHHGEGHGLLFEYTLDQPITLEPLDASMNLDCCGRGFVIRRNEFRASRYRGLLIRSLDGIIEDNRIFSVGMAGILLGSNLFSEGPYAQGICVRRNSICRTGLLPFAHSGRGIAVLQNVDAEGLPVPKVPLNRDIVVEDNRISDVTCEGIYVRNSSHVVLRNNTVSDIGIRPTSNKTPPQAILQAD